MPTRRSRVPALTQAYVDATGKIIRAEFDQVVFSDAVGDLGNLTQVVSGLDSGFTVGNTSDAAGPAAPELQTAVVDATGLEVTLTFDEPLRDGTEAGWTVAGQTPDSGAVTAGVLVLTLPVAILDGAAVAVDYDAATGDAVGLVEPVADIADFAATNNSTVTE